MPPPMPIPPPIEAAPPVGPTVPGTLDPVDLMRRSVDPLVNPDMDSPATAFPQGPSARLLHADAKSQMQPNRDLNYDELTAPDDIITAMKLRNQTDPVKVGRTAAILSQYGEGTMQGPTPEARLAATQLDWAKVATLFRSGKITDSGKTSQWDGLEDLSDDDAGQFMEFVRSIGDMTDSVYSKDLSDVDRIEIGLVGPMMHLSATATARTDRAMPTSMPYIAEGGDNNVALPDGSVAVLGKAETKQAAVRHLAPLVTRPDGVSLWGAREPLRVMDAVGFQRTADSELVGHHVERWTTAAFDGRHPATLPDRTVLVDLVGQGSAQKVSKLGTVIDPGEPAVVVRPDPEDRESRTGTRARRLAVRLKADADLADVLATAKLIGAEPVAVYAPGDPPSGWAQATEQHLDDSVVNVVVRHNAGPPQHGEFGVFLPDSVVSELPTFRASRPTWTRSGGVVDYGVALCVDGVLGKKGLSFGVNADGIPTVTEGDTAKLSKGEYVIQGDPNDLLPAARQVQLLRELGQKARLETTVDGKTIPLK